MSNVSKPKSSYYIRRIRLINFHNFVDETIEIENGGHLFLLGDNACGKTTVLDAIHYVLTAGEQMEFNSAARVVGNKAEGRRLQGVITRFNVDTGPLNPEGGVTYAALEVSGRLGKPYTIAIGITVGGIDEPVKSWGIIRECSLEEIPFLVDELEGVRPRNSHEIKEFLGKGYVYGNIGTYKKVIADRFFGGSETFRTVCHFLFMSKAYREIVAKSSDYHELFKKLLPESATDLFERIIDSLRTLDASRGDLDNLKQKYQYVIRLHSHILAVNELRKKGQCCDIMILEAQIDIGSKDLDLLHQTKDKKALELGKAEEEIARLKKQKEHIERRLTDFRAQDASGLVRQEKELAKDFEHIQGKRTDHQQKIAECNKAIKHIEKQLTEVREKLQLHLKHQLRSLSSLGPNLPFSVAELIAAIEEALHTENAEDMANKIPTDRFLKIARESQNGLISAAVRLEEQLKQKNSEQDVLQREIKSIRSRTESTPTIPEYVEAEESLRNALTDAHPLYKGLEWKPGIDQATMAEIEEFIGENILGMFLVPEESVESSKDIILNHFQDIRICAIASLDVKNCSFPPWIKTVFDINNSDPYCLVALNDECITHRGPEFDRYHQLRTVRFRSHERRLLNKIPRLIGSEARRREHVRQVKEKEKDLQRTQKELKKLVFEQTHLNTNQTNLQKFIQLLEQGIKEISDLISQIGNSKTELFYASEGLKEDEAWLNDSETEALGYQERLLELRAIISKEGLDKLEEKIRKATKQYESCQKKLEETQNGIGRIQQQIDDIQQLQEVKTQDLATAEEKRADARENFQKRYPEIADIDILLNEFNTDQRLTSISDITKAANGCRNQVLRIQGEISGLITDPVYNPVYAFSYDSEDNSLLDRQSRTIFQIVALQEQHINEQQDVINDKTNELFRKIIMNELITFFKSRVYHLKTMIKKINYLLADRKFGENQYRFHLTPIPKFERFLDIIRDHNPLDISVEKELKNFFDDYKSEIIDTEVSQVPEVLDYRNWYRYEMKVMSPNNDGKIIDRRTKSIGSGGEQAVPNYLLVMTIAHFLYEGSGVHLRTLLFDEAFYGIDAGRRDQLMGFASDLNLQLFVASPDQDGVKQEIKYSTSLLVVKDQNYDVHLYPFHWDNPKNPTQQKLFEDNEPKPICFANELPPTAQPG